jgi:uncharacterized phage protein (TIGR01671 family)
MREIKFRAWHKNLNYMSPVGSIGLETDKTALIYFPVQNNDGDIDWDAALVDIAELELMQYTGVKDKNGKEIYEGDIISYKYYRTAKRWWSSLEEIPIIEAEVEAQKNDISSQKSIVIFEDGIFRLKDVLALTFKHVSKNEKYERKESSHANIETKSWDFEVIGNIHENPELLEDVR